MDQAEEAYDGDMLVELVKDVWTDTRTGTFVGVETGTRMTVVRLRDGGLFVHSPVDLDSNTLAEVNALGEVRAVVAPSIFHHLYVGQWMGAYPKAVFGACPGLEWKRKDLAFNYIVADEPHPVWSGDLEQVYFSARRENEVVFYHKPTKTMICADALLNLSVHGLASTRFVARLMGNSAPGVGYLEPLMIRDRKLARRQADRILAWDIERSVVGHGGMIEHDGHQVFRNAYAWL